jgi:hypothetical protein
MSAGVDLHDLVIKDPEILPADKADCRTGRSWEVPCIKTPCPLEAPSYYLAETRECYRNDRTTPKNI